MNRLLASLAAVAVLGADATAQVRPARSMAYLFTAGVEDARALWLNPAGLAVNAGASLMGEFVAEQRSASPWELRQYALGLSSRGIGVGYQRDRLPAGGSAGTWSLGGAVGLGRGSVGAVYNFYRPERGLDVGLRWAPVNSLRLAAAARNIGRPLARDSTLPVVGVAGFQWRPATGVLRLSGEAAAAERQVSSGYVISYRAGAQASLGRRRRLTVLAALDLKSDLGLSRWSVGVVIGGDYHAALVGTVAPASGVQPKFETGSLTGVATRRLLAR